MSRVLVLGAGLMGPAIAGDLVRYGIAGEVVVADADPERVRRAVEKAEARKAGIESGVNVRGKVLDLGNRRALVREMREADVVAGAYPVAMVREVTEAAIEAGTHLCDLTGSAEGFNVFDYHEAAASAGIVILPGCGLAPGLTNILAGQGAARLGGAKEGVLYVGGLPLNPLPPLGYRVVFSLDTVIDEYVAPALVVRDGETAEVPALDGLEELTFPEPVGRCEAFYTYGLGTLAWTGRELGFRDLSEKTVRYPGHRDKVLFLRECGFFSREPVDIDGTTVVPRKLAAAVLAPLLARGGEADVSVLRVVVKAGEEGWVFEMVDHYDPATQTTSMARTTGYTCSIIAGLVLRGLIEGPGVAPLERVFTASSLYGELRQELGRRGIVIRERRLGAAPAPR
ncbi:MAG: hypothetical protein C4551_11130 [Bacillota bacterium]|nr:MAG: hypothetical protein C4551_11130 [Bacillota bacterium]